MIKNNASLIKTHHVFKNYSNFEKFKAKNPKKNLLIMKLRADREVEKKI